MWETITPMSYFHVNLSPMYFVMEIVCRFEFFWYQIGLDLHIFKSVEWGGKVKNLDIQCAIFHIWCLNVLFQRIFEVVRSAVLVVNSAGYSIKFPPTVIHARLGSSLCGQ